MSLEKIVRPFQTGDVFAPRVLSPTQPAQVVTQDDTSSLSWAGGNSGDYDEGPDLWLAGFNSKWVEDKSQRVTEKIRVENPDDDSQYVEMERINKMAFKKQATGEMIQLNMDWSNTVEPF